MFEPRGRPTYALIPNNPGNPFLTTNFLFYGLEFSTIVIRASILLNVGERDFAQFSNRARLNAASQTQADFTNLLCMPSGVKRQQQ